MRNLSLPIIATAVLLFSACEKTNDIKGGKNGTAILGVHPEYEGVEGGLVNCTVYIKYDATQPPADGVYDDSVQCLSTDSTVTGQFYSLQNGNYYLYAKGLDTTFNQTVKGGTSFNVSKQGLTSNAFIPVMQ